MDPSTIIMILIGLWSLFVIRNNSKNKTELTFTSKQQNEIIVVVERIENQIFLWDKESNEFVAQGKDIEEALDKAVERFKDTVIKIRQEDYQNSLLAEKNLKG